MRRIKVCGVRCVVCGVLMLFIIATGAQAQRRSQTAIGIGSANTYDNYLSPLEYTGYDLTFMHVSTRILGQQRIASQGIWRASIMATENPVGNRNEYGAQLGYQHAWHYNWAFGLPRADEARALVIRAGLGIAADVGALYNTHAGNNPAQGYLSTAIVASTETDYSFNVRWWSKNASRRTFTLRLHLDAPLIGAMFSPDYGQSYYNIFSQGNYSRNIVVTTPINCPTLRGHLTLTLPVGRHRMSIGYGFDALQAKPNNLRRHTYLNNLLVGWERTF